MTKGVVNDHFGNGVGTVADSTVIWSSTQVNGYGLLPGTLVETLTDIGRIAEASVWRGRRVDSIGLIYLGARYYDSTSGRFASADPAGQTASMSLYDYCAGDPVNFVDADGRDKNPVCSAPNNGALNLQQAQALASQLGWNGFTMNLSERQQLYYGQTAAHILALQAQDKDVSALWKAVVGEVPGVIVDSNGNMAGDSADLPRIKFLVGAGAIGGVTVGVTDTLARIARGESFPHRNDGAVFQNREGMLPRQAPGYYREYVVPTQGNPGSGAQRVVIGQSGEIYYAADHYWTFVRVPAGGSGGDKRPDGD